jgi:Protein of unknown function (DUF3500)
LALNITIAGSRGVLTPTLTGAQPALYTSNGKTVRPLGRESDKALVLLNALDDNQRNKAILSYELADLVLGPGQDGKTIQPEGLKASEMNERQRAMLVDVISEWAGIIHESAAAARMAEIEAGLNDTWFAWSGPVTAVPGRNITAYYRIQGPNLVIEYAPQRLGGDPAMHVHTMYRDQEAGTNPTLANIAVQRNMNVRSENYEEFASAHKQFFFLSSYVLRNLLLHDGKRVKLVANMDGMDLYLVTS